MILAEVSDTFENANRSDQFILGKERKEEGQFVKGNI